jgi:hypothetical protein
LQSLAAGAQERSHGVLEDIMSNGRITALAIHLSLALTLSPILGGCPAQGDDDDDDDGGNTIEVTGDEACGPLLSVVWTVDPDSEAPGMALYASTVAGFCGLFWEYQDLIDTAYPFFADALFQALEDEDGLAACEATLAYYTALTSTEQSMYPAGSCTMLLMTSDTAPGIYDADLGWGEGGAWGTLMYADGDWSADTLAAFDDCASVTDLESWSLLQEQVDAVIDDTMRMWSTTTGTVELTAETDDAIGASATDLAMTETALETPGTLGFELLAEACAP